MKMNNVNGLPKWLTPELMQKVRDFYEPQYKKPLSDFEVFTVAENLSQIMEHYLKFTWRMRYGNE